MDLPVAAARDAASRDAAPQRQSKRAPANHNPETSTRPADVDYEKNDPRQN